MSEPLNPWLYKSLCRRFGDVRVIHAGEPIQWRIIHPAMGLEGETRPYREVLMSGEEYILSCPFCHDTKRRLYINHRWGVDDPLTGTKNWWLAQCLNETACLAKFERQQQLYEMLKAFIPRGSKFKVRPVREQIARKLVEVSPPGVVIPIGELAAREPNHPAVLYLEDRGFDCQTLERLYAVAYCLQSNRYSLAEDRIVIPVLHRGKMVGWQCRHVGDAVEGISLKELEIPKYWTMPGFPKGRIAYNYDRAIRHRVVAIVEGPTDVWRTGSNAMAVLGTSMSRRLQRRFIRDMERLHGDAGIVVAMLDPPKPKQKRASYMKRLVLALAPKFPKRLVVVNLPVGTDPGSLDRSLTWRMVREEASRMGIRLPSLKEKV